MKVQLKGKAGRTLSWLHFSRKRLVLARKYVNDLSLHVAVPLIALLHEQ
jgi:hypothetical protein